MRLHPGRGRGPVIMASGGDIERRTVEFRPGSRNVFLHVLTQCNLRCRHCYIDREQHGRGMLDEATLHRWLEIFASQASPPPRGILTPHGAPPPKVEETNVIFLGGEPTLNPSLPGAIRHARALGYASITVDTNGYLFHDFLDKVSPEHVDYLSFSLDGSVAAVNDPIRGEGVFEACTAGLRRARGQGFSLSLIFTASRLNLHDLPNMPPLLAELGVKRFFIQVIGIRGRSAKEAGSRLQLSYQEWKDVVPKVAEEAARMGIHVTYPKVFLAPEEPFACAALVADNYFVFPNRRVYRCPLCEDYPIHAMEIEDEILRLRPPLTESDLFSLQIPEGCVLNRILHPGNVDYDEAGRPCHRIACCMLKEEVWPGGA